MADSERRALEVLASLVLEDGRRWGEAAEPWQWADAGAVLDLSGPRFHYQTRPRGASKTTDAGAVVTAALLEQLPPVSESLAYAADRDQAALIVTSIGGFVRRTPGLSQLLKVDNYRVTNKRTGAWLSVEAADDASAWGKRPHLVLVDEWAQWMETRRPRALWTAIFSALPKVATSRLLVMTSAGDPAHGAYRLLERSRASERWRVSELPGPCPWISEADLAEQRAELSESQYRRLHLNEWTSAEDRLTSLDDLAACVQLDGPLRPVAGVDYVVAVDLGLKSDRTVAVVVHAEPFDVDGDRDGSRGFEEDLAHERYERRTIGMSPWAAEKMRRREGGSPERGVRVVLDRIAVWQGSRSQAVQLSEVEEWIFQASESFGHARVVADPWQAVGMAQRLQARGVAVKEFVFSSASVGRLASTLHLLLRNRALVLPDDEELVEELSNVRLRETSPGVIRMDHDADRHDDRAVALAMGAFELLESAPTAAGPIQSLDLRLSSGRRAR